MNKKLLVLFLSLCSQAVIADCLSLYNKESDEIQKKYGYTKRVGSQIFHNPHTGGLGYLPGVKVQADIHNWAEDFTAAISIGPGLSYYASGDPRRKWLEAFRKAIKKDCPLPEKNHKKLRGMLRELMIDGSFCPDGKIIPYKFPAGKGPFKRVLKEAVQAGRFSSTCKNDAIADDSFRKIKSVDSTSTEINDKKSSSGQ